MSQPEPGAAVPTPPQGLPQPQFRILAQYVKDLSFENPNAPASLVPKQGKPEIGINVDINSRRITDNQFETDLRISVDGRQDGQVQFIIDLLYSGLFHLQGISPENLESVLLIECPRQLFPFARRVLADATRDGGFPPLLIEPIDFAAIYRQQLQRRAQEQAGAAPKQRSGVSF